MAPFGKHGSEAVRLITLRLGRMTVKVSTFGATITSLAVPSALGEPTETVLGFAEHKPYESCPYFGCTVGRFANRIAKGSFTLEGKPIQLPACNDRGNHLHGGARGWDKRVWELVEASATACTLKLRSEDGDEGYPGNVDATVSFTLEWPSQIAIEYDLTTDAPTVVNPTNHSYFNLSDGGATDVLDHDLMVFADKYLPTDATCIPTGELKPVSGPMDLRRPTPIFRGIHAADGGNGYDHNYVLAAEAGAHEDGRRLRRAAWVRSPKTGIELLVLTTEPGAQRRAACALACAPALTASRTPCPPC